MVTFKNVGRLGNFLFEAAATMAYAWDHGLEFTMPTEARDGKWHPVYLQHLVNPNFNSNLPTIAIEEQSMSRFNPLPFKESWRKGNIVLDGYWQNAKYFQHHRERLIKAFGYSYITLGIVSVHVRRGDYLTIKRGKMFKHPPVSKEWIEEQMRKFAGQGKSFMFFSDDIAWCEQEFSGRDDCDFSSGYTEEDDLVSMACCEHHICSASTFSWWAAWLNQNPEKRVIMPKHWLTPGWHADQPDPVQGMGWERA